MKIPIKDYMKKTKDTFGTRSTKAGSYSFFMTIIVLAILVLVNVGLSFFPDSYVQEDLLQISCILFQASLRYF